MPGKGDLKIGTSSWKYDSWKGLIYPDKESINYLEEYAKHFNTVEIDQWFWSLFEGYDPKMPDNRTAKEYADSVPDDFVFTIKVPNSITLTHYYNKNKKSDELKENRHFLSTDLFNRFLDSISPVHGKLGPLMFQFEYLNKKKMSSQSEFQDKFGEFISKLDTDFPLALESRNPNYLNDKYVKFINDTELLPVFLQGYYMPPIFNIIDKFGNFASGKIIIRLHGPDRKGIEKKSGGNWDKIVEPKDDEIEKLADLIEKIRSEGTDIYLNVNNHFEGSAPKTIEKINKQLEKKEG